MARGSTVRWSWATTMLVLLAGCGRVPPVAAPPPLSQDAPEPGPLADTGDIVTETRDPRVLNRRVRARPLLVVEIQALSRLLDASPKGQPDRVQIERRLAEDNVELAAAAARDKATAVMRAARTRAISLYTAILAEEPGYPQADEVRYDLALEYERAGDKLNAQRCYYLVTQLHPKSRYLPLAYLGFAERYAAEAETDPWKRSFAELTYEAVLTRAPTSDRAYAYACLRLGALLWNEDRARAEALLARGVPATSVDASPDALDRR
jgi:hypothetical protein